MAPQPELKDRSSVGFVIDQFAQVARIAMRAMEQPAPGVTAFTRVEDDVLGNVEAAETALQVSLLAPIGSGDDGSSLS